MQNLVLFAADWTKVIVPIVFFVLWAIQQVAAGRQKAAKAPQAPRPQKPRPDAAEALRRQIETYLAETDQKRDGSGGRPQGEPVARDPRKRPSRPERGPRQVRGETPRRSNRPSDQPATAPSATPTLAPVSSAPDGSVVASDIGAHVDEAFTHEIGHLHGSSLAKYPADENSAKGADATPPATPGGIVDAIRDPRQMRNAIVLSTILERPRY